MRLVLLLVACLLLAYGVRADGDNGETATATESETTEAPLLLTEAEVKKLRVKVIRKLLKERGQECKGCVEKEEFVAKFLEVQWMPKQEPPPRKKTAQEKMEDDERLKDIMDALKKGGGGGMNGMNFKTFTPQDFEGLSPDEMAKKFGEGGGGGAGARGGKNRRAGKGKTSKPAAASTKSREKEDDSEHIEL